MYIGFPRSIMVKNLVRLCEMLGGWYPSLSASRRTVYDSHLSTFYYFQGNCGRPMK